MKPINRLKYIVPTVQVLLLVAAGLWPHILGKYCDDRPEVIDGYAYAPIYILVKVNFPLAIAWFPIFSSLTWAYSQSYLRLTSGAEAVVRAVLDLAIVSSVALFWYFVVVETEKRRRGASLIRFKSRALETLKGIVLIAAGVGALAYACWDGHRLFLLAQLNASSLYWIRMVYAVVGGLFLVMWAILLIKVGIKDLVAFVREPSA